MPRKRIPVEELRFGMYVAELDRPWTDTPFLFQGFVLSTQKQLDLLRQYCSSVVVDAERGEAAATHTPAAPRYAEQASVEQEIAPARAAYGGTRVLMHEVLAGVRVGRSLDPARIASAVATMAESVLRNPDALLLLSQLRAKGEYNESHALDVSVYLITFARFLELEPDQIELLGYLGLLQDVGKLRLPKHLLDRRGRLSAEEVKLAQRHVAYSVEILQATPGLPAELPRLAALHHERHDGSGYPAGLRGGEIGLLGSMAAIVDTYDALTVQRPHADAVSPSAAISTLYKGRGTLFDAHLVEQFIRCIGIFPVGSLVELNSGEVGVVIAQNATRRLSPRVMVIRDAAGNPMIPQKLLDLARAPKATVNETYRILGTLERGSVPFDTETMILK